MTKEQAKEFYPIMQAFAEGKPIQSRCIKGDTSLWYDDEKPNFDYDDFEYRIKPETKFRPFANAEECWAEMEKHQPFGWVKDRNGSKSTIENIDYRGCLSINDDGICNFYETFENYTFADGTPFGVKVEE